MTRGTPARELEPWEYSDPYEPLHTDFVYIDTELAEWALAVEEGTARRACEKNLGSGYRTPLSSGAHTDSTKDGTEPFGPAFMHDYWRDKVDARQQRIEDLEMAVDARSDAAALLHQIKYRYLNEMYDAMIDGLQEKAVVELTEQDLIKQKQKEARKAGEIFHPYKALTKIPNMLKTRSLGPRSYERKMRVKATEYEGRINILTRYPESDLAESMRVNLRTVVLDSILHAPTGAESSDTSDKRKKHPSHMDRLLNSQDFMRLLTGGKKS